MGFAARRSDELGGSGRPLPSLPPHGAFLFLQREHTFASIVRLVIKKLDLPEERAVVVRSLAGHIVAGVATAEEERAFREFCVGLEG